MRKVYDTNGNDVTSTALSFLRANRTLYACDLMMLSTWIWWFPVNGMANGTPEISYPGPAPQYMNFYFSFGDFPVQVGYAQTGPNTVLPLTMWNTNYAGFTAQPATFLPQALDRDKYSYGIGFTAENADVTWYCGDALVPVPVTGYQPPWNSPQGSPYFYSASSPPIAVQPGRTISLKWMGGVATGGGTGNYTTGFGTGAVGTNFGALAGTFLDASGNVVQGPFIIGTGLNIPVPQGASQLTLGCNDNGLDDTDNGGVWMVWVSGYGNVAQPYYPTLQQAFSAGMFDECNVNLYRAFFNGDPKQGGSLLGTTLMFRGFVREAESAQDHVKLSLASLLDLFQEVQLPTQIVQPGNRTTPYVPSGVSYSVNTIDLVNSTPSVLRFSAGSSVPDHALQDGYLRTGGPNSYTSPTSWTPVNNQPPPVFLRIRDNATISGVLYIYLYEPTVIPIANIGRGYGDRGQVVNIGVDLLLQNPLSNSYGAPGFPSVPPPEIGI